MAIIKQEKCVEKSFFILGMSYPRTFPSLVGIVDAQTYGAEMSVPNRQVDGVDEDRVGQSVRHEASCTEKM